MATLIRIWRRLPQPGSDPNAGGAHDATEIHERFLVDLVLKKQTLVVTKIPQKPT
jgi:hypothetical protein